MRAFALSIPLVLALLSPTLATAEKRPLEFEDLLKFRQIEEATISRDGSWIAYALVPDRGDGEGVARAIHGGRELRVERGRAPRLTGDGKWVAFRQEPSFEATETAEEGEEPRPGLVLIDTESDERVVFEEVQAFAFSEDDAWLAIHHHLPRPEEDEDEGEEENEDEEPRTAGGALALRRLATGLETRFEQVREWALDDAGRWLALARATESGEENAIAVVDLTAEGEPRERTLATREKGLFAGLRWAKDRSLLAWVESDATDEKKPTEASVHLFDGSDASDVARGEQLADGWEIAPHDELVFSRDGERLFFGLRKRAPETPEDEAPESQEEGETEEPAFDPWDLEKLLGETTLDVWHWRDPHIQSHQRESWEEEKKKSWRAVVHLEDGAVVQLANEHLPDVVPSENPRVALGRSDRPYRIEKSYDGWFHDLRLVDLRTGAQTHVATRIHHGGSLSPDGRFLAWYEDPHWHLLEIATGERRNLTEGLPVSFADELHDVARAAPAYGMAGWVEGDAALLLYDRYDLWRIPTDEGEPLRLSDGRDEQLVYRVQRLDPEALAFAEDEELLLLGFDDRRKSSSFHRGRVDRPGTERLRAAEKRYRFLAKAEEADRILYTEERFDEFPDLWAASTGLRGARKLSDANPQIDDFLWGKAELIDYLSADGVPLQGVVIKPAGYDEDERYPVLVYYYRRFSQRLHEFNEPVVNHRPSFPLYASHGYVVFLPDIHFEVGTPGLSATKSLVPAVQKLIDLGIADPERVGLHGHSWSGYQTAHVITQTDLFAAAVAGAPVSNMTSAYGGIRYGSGLSRQFQYEKGQSRMGGSLWEVPTRYWENSPLFFADRIETPLLIEFGMEDGAVPWTQGVELYMAMRRLEKPCVMLAYRGEPHHLKQPANQLDYSIKMKEFLDHFLKDAPAPDWWVEGVPYRGD